MTLIQTMARGARSFRASVTVDGSTERLMPLNGTGRGIQLVGNKAATYEELYRTQVWVHAVVNRLARSIARLPLKVFVSPDEPAERQRLRTGPLPDLLRRPGYRMGPGEMKQHIVSNVAIHGNCVLVKSRRMTGAPVVELLPSSFAYWDVRADESGAPWYVFSPGNRAAIPFRPEEILHFRWWAGGAGLRAVSSLDALRTTLMTEDATQRMTIASFENGARPEGAFSVEGSLRAEEMERAREQLQQIYGGVDNAFKLALLDHGAKWLPISHTLVDSELINLRKLSREEVAAAYNMPPPVIGILDRATFSNISEQHLMEYMDTVQPWTSMIEEALAVQLIEFEPGMQGQYAEFDFNAVLAGDPVKRIEVLTKAVGGPFMTPNEGRATQNLPPLTDDRADRLAPPANASVREDSSGGNS